METEHPENNAAEQAAADGVQNHIEEQVGAKEAQAAAETIRMPEEKHRSWFSSFLHFLFSSETAVGRFMRPLLRWAAFILILFSAGLLVMYFWRVRPAERLWAQTAAELTVAQQSLSGARDEVATSRNEMDAMQTRMQAAETEALTASQHLLLVTLRNDVAAARLALIADKDVASAILNLSAAELDLQALTPAIDQFNSALAGELKQNLERIQKGLKARPVNQSSLANELFSFDVKLLGLEKLMFPESN